MNDVLRSSEFELTIDNDCRRYLHDTAGWGKFIAIAGLIFSAFMVVVGIMVAGQENRADSIFASEEAQEARKMGTIVGTIIFAAIYVFPCIVLLRYTAKLRSALAANNQEDLNQAFRSQKNLYIYMGVLTILGLIFLLLAIAGLAMGSNQA